MHNTQAPEQTYRLSTRVREGDIILAPTTSYDFSFSRWPTDSTQLTLPSSDFYYRVCLSENDRKNTSHRLREWLERHANSKICDRACYLVAKCHLHIPVRQLSSDTDGFNLFLEAKTSLKNTHSRADSTSCIPKIAVQTRNLHRVYKVSRELGVWAL